MTNSFRGGTGKSTIISNLGTYLASFGFKVIIIDADVISPGVHAMFGLNPREFSITLTDYLKGKKDIKEAVYDISQTIKLPDESLFLVPSSMSQSDIAELLMQKGTSVKLVQALPKLVEAYVPDYILIDTHPGLNKEVLVTFNDIDILLNIVRPDNQDYQGLEVSSGVAKKFKIQTFIVLNRVHAKIRDNKLKKKIENAFKLPVAGMLPLSEDIILSQSQFVFCERYPEHEFSQEIQVIAENVFGVKPRTHLELMRFILGVIKEKAPVTLEELRTTKNVFIPSAEKYFSDLLAKGFISKTKDKKGDVLYSTTQKGSKFLDKYKVINKFVNNFRL